MDRAYCICISGKYLIFYYMGGGFAELESVLQTGQAAVALQSAGAQEAEGAREGSGAGRRRDKQEGAAGSDLVPLLFTLYKNDFAKGRIWGGVGNPTTQMIKIMEGVRHKVHRSRAQERHVTRVD